MTRNATRLPLAAQLGQLAHRRLARMLKRLPEPLIPMLKPGPAMGDELADVLKLPTIAALGAAAARGDVAHLVTVPATVEATPVADPGLHPRQSASVGGCTPVDIRCRATVASVERCSYGSQVAPDHS